MMDGAEYTTDTAIKQLKIAAEYLSEHRVSRSHSTAQTHVETAIALLEVGFTTEKEE